MKKLAIVILVFVVISYLLLTQLPDRKLHVVFCDVGQGDGIVLRSPQNTTYLVDSGPDASILSCLGEKTPFFNRSIHTIFISHLHADHLSGAIEVVKRYSVKNITTNTIDYSTIETQELFKEIEENRINIIELEKGKHLSIDSAIVVQTHWPGSDSWNKSNGNWKAYLDDFNDSSQVLTIQHGEVLFIMTGDAGAKVLEGITLDPAFTDIVNHAVYRILKVPHHGSRDASSEIFLNAVKPDLAIISSGVDNDYNHPHQESIELLESKNIPIARTDVNGNIEVISDGARVWTKYDKKK